MDTTEELVDFCCSLTYKGLPFEVIDRVKYHALDMTGVAARGSLTASSQIMRDLVKDLDPNLKGSVVIGTDMRVSPQYAALANGTASHSIHMADMNHGHPGAVVFPAAFAVSEFSGCDGRKFAEGIVLGYEVMVRLLKVLSPVLVDGHPQGFYTTGICGALAAAIVTSKILDLNRDQMLSALGIAGSQASGSFEFMSNGAWTYEMHAGWSAHNGIIAALLAKRGFKGPSTIIEGRYGFLRSYSGSFEPDKVVAGLGSSYEITETLVKRYSCATAEQGPIEGILKIMKEHNLKPEEVNEVICRIPEAAWNMVAEPIELKRNPRTEMEALISMPFGAAMAILYGSVSVDEYSHENMNSPEVKGLMSRVSCVKESGAEKNIGEKPPTVAIMTKDGRSFSAEIEHPKGEPENPLSWEELIEKYNNLTSSLYSQGRRNEIIGRVRKLEEEKKMANFCNLLLREVR